MKLDLDQRQRRCVGVNGVIQGRNAMSTRHRVSRSIQRLLNAGLATTFIAFTAQSARADDAEKLLKAKSDYSAAQKSISATFDSDIEIVTPELERFSLQAPENCSLRGRTNCGSVEPAAMPTFS
jgi:hypothetical protein